MSNSNAINGHSSDPLNGRMASSPQQNGRMLVGSNGVTSPLRRQSNLNATAAATAAAAAATRGLRKSIPVVSQMATTDMMSGANGTARGRSQPVGPPQATAMPAQQQQPPLPSRGRAMNGNEMNQTLPSLQLRPSSLHPKAVSAVNPYPQEQLSSHPYMSNSASTDSEVATPSNENGRSGSRSPRQPRKRRTSAHLLSSSDSAQSVRGASPARLGSAQNQSAVQPPMSNGKPAGAVDTRQPSDPHLKANIPNPSKLALPSTGAALHRTSVSVSDQQNGLVYRYSVSNAAAAAAAGTIGGAIPSGRKQSVVSPPSTLQESSSSASSQGNSAHGRVDGSVEEKPPISRPAANNVPLYPPRKPVEEKKGINGNAAAPPTTSPSKTAATTGGGVVMNGVPQPVPFGNPAPISPVSKAPPLEKEPVRRIPKPAQESPSPSSFGGNESSGARIHPSASEPVSTPHKQVSSPEEPLFRKTAASADSPHLSVMRDVEVSREKLIGSTPPQPPPPPPSDPSVPSVGSTTPHTSRVSTTSTVATPSHRISSAMLGIPHHKMSEKGSAVRTSVHGPLSKLANALNPTSTATTTTPTTSDATPAPSTLGAKRSTVAFNSLPQPPPLSQEQQRKHSQQPLQGASPPLQPTQAPIFLHSTNGRTGSGVFQKDGAFSAATRYSQDTTSMIADDADDESSTPLQLAPRDFAVSPVTSDGSPATPSSTNPLEHLNEFKKLTSTPVHGASAAAALKGPASEAFSTPTNEMWSPTSEEVGESERTDAQLTNKGEDADGPPSKTSRSSSLRRPSLPPIHTYMFPSDEACVYVTAAHPTSVSTTPNKTSSPAAMSTPMLFGGKAPPQRQSVMRWSEPVNSNKASNFVRSSSSNNEETPIPEAQDSGSNVALTKSKNSLRNSMEKQTLRANRLSGNDPSSGTLDDADNSGMQLLTPHGFQRRRKASKLGYPGVRRSRDSSKGSLRASTVMQNSALMHASMNSGHSSLLSSVKRMSHSSKSKSDCGTEHFLVPGTAEHLPQAVVRGRQAPDSDAPIAKATATTNAVYDLSGTKDDGATADETLFESGNPLRSEESGKGSAIFNRKNSKQRYSNRPKGSTVSYPRSGSQSSQSPLTASSSNRVGRKSDASHDTDLCENEGTAFGDNPLKPRKQPSTTVHQQDAHAKGQRPSALDPSEVTQTSIYSKEDRHGSESLWSNDDQLTNNTAPNGGWKDADATAVTESLLFEQRSCGTVTPSAARQNNNNKMNHDHHSKATEDSWLQSVDHVASSLTVDELDDDLTASVNSPHHSHHSRNRTSVAGSRNRRSEDLQEHTLPERQVVKPNRGIHSERQQTTVAEQAVGDTTRPHAPVAPRIDAASAAQVIRMPSTSISNTNANLYPGSRRHTAVLVAEEAVDEVQPVSKEWLQIPILNYLFVLLIQLHELSTMHKTEGNVIAGGAGAIDRRETEQWLLSHIGQAISEADSIILNPLFTTWSDRKLYTTLKTMTYEWGRHGPSPQFYKAYLNTLKYVRAEYKAQVEYTWLHTLWRGMGNSSRFPYEFAAYIACAVIAVVCVVVLNALYHVRPVNIVLSVVLAVLVLVLCASGALIAHHNSAMASFAAFFQDDVYDSLADSIDDNEDDADDTQQLSSELPANQSTTAPKTFTGSDTGRWVNVSTTTTERTTPAGSTIRTEKAQAAQNPRYPTQIQQQEWNSGESHAETHQGNAPNLPTGALTPAGDRTHTSSVRSPVSTAERDSYVGSSVADMWTAAEFKSEEDIIRNMDGITDQQRETILEYIHWRQRTVRARRHNKEKQAADLERSKYNSVITNIVSFQQHQLRKDENQMQNLRKHLQSGRDSIVLPSDQLGADGRSAPSDSPASRVLSPGDKTLHSVTADSKTLAALGDTAGGTANSNNRYNNNNNNKQDDFFIEEAAPLQQIQNDGSLGEDFSRQESGNADAPESATGGAVTDALSTHSGSRASISGRVRYLFDDDNDAENNVNGDAESLDYRDGDAISESVDHESVASDALDSIYITALVLCSDSALSTGVLQGLWENNFLVMCSASMKRLATAYFTGSERFKVLILNVEDVASSDVNIQVARSWMDARRPVFFFGHGVDYLPKQISPRLRLSSPLSAQNVDTLFLAGLGADDSFASISDMSSEATFVVPAYTLSRRLGGGAFGNVFEAVLEDSGAVCAVKRIYIKTEEEDGGTQLQDIAREVEIMGSLTHPNIVHYLFSERDGNCVSIFMELCNEGSLTTYIAKLMMRDAEDVKRVLREIVGAVSYLHGKRIVHRDLKPDNILFNEGHVKLTDFGTAVLNRGTLSNVKGTFSYMAPEVLVGEPYGTPCDVWSIGCIAAEVLAVNLPHRSLSLPELCDKYERMTGDQEVDIECTSESILEFLQACLHRNPDKRNLTKDILSHPILTDDDDSIQKWMDLVRANTRRTVQRSSGIAKSGSDQTGSYESSQQPGRNQTSMNGSFFSLHQLRHSHSSETGQSAANAVDQLSDWDLSLNDVGGEAGKSLSSIRDRTSWKRGSRLLSRVSDEFDNSKHGREVPREVRKHSDHPHVAMVPTLQYTPSSTPLSGTIKKTEEESLSDELQQPEGMLSTTAKFNESGNAPQGAAGGAAKSPTKGEDSSNPLPNIHAKRTTSPR